MQEIIRVTFEEKSINKVFGVLYLLKIKEPVRFYYKNGYARDDSYKVLAKNFYASDEINKYI